jgi:beta-lactamase superfamily II metal-dependent hydrolase
MTKQPRSLRVHVLNVGDGDSIIVEFPEVNGNRRYGVVDCSNATKTIDYLKKLGVKELEFVCATHPHYDHIRGMPKLLSTFQGAIHEFWDSGFRHTSLTHERVITNVEADTNIRFSRVTSGTEKMCNGVKVCVMAPSIALRNRYDTWGININNASIVIKLEYLYGTAKKAGIILLGADAQFDSWSKVVEEFPAWEKTENPDQRIQVGQGQNPLNCQVLKVSHHGSKHGTMLEFVEKLSPRHAIVSCSGTSTYGFPHELALLALEETTTDRYFTDGGHGIQRSGTSVVECNGTNQPDVIELRESRSAMATPPP